MSKASLITQASSHHKMSPSGWSEMPNRGGTRLTIHVIKKANRGVVELDELGMLEQLGVVLQRDHGDDDEDLDPQSDFGMIM